MDYRGRLVRNSVSRPSAPRSCPPTLPVVLRLTFTVRFKLGVFFLVCVFHVYHVPNAAVVRFRAVGRCHCSVVNAIIIVRSSMMSTRAVGHSVDSVRQGLFLFGGTWRFRALAGVNITARKWFV